MVKLTSCKKLILIKKPVLKLKLARKILHWLISELFVMISHEMKIQGDNSV
jgi:hypothetical protein